MKITVNNQEAAISEGLSFDYISENRLFSSADGYTLSIDFPLKDCPQNLAIFGNVNRKDVALGKIRFDCEILDRNVFLSGTLTITKITETVLTGQFLEGRSAQNFDDTFDEIYINELDLGSPADTSIDQAPASVWNVSGSPDVEAVALPWVNDSSDGAVNNFASTDSSTEPFAWDDDVKGLSFFPYLLHIAKKICEAEGVGYSYDFTAWENTDWRWLLVCNALPYTWDLPQYARALPHWSITDFFEKLEKLMSCEFDIDHKKKKISMSFTADVQEQLEVQQIPNIVDSYSSDVSADEHSAGYLGAKNLKYKDLGYDAWNIVDCAWYLKTCTEFKEFATFEELWSYAGQFADYSEYGTLSPGSPKRHPEDILHAQDIDSYFILKVTSHSREVDNEGNGNRKIITGYTTSLLQVNTFGPRIVDDTDDADEEELELVPVRIEETDRKHGVAMFLSPTSYDEDNDDSDDDTDSTLPMGNLSVVQSKAYQAIAKGEAEAAEYYSVINVGFWKGIPSATKLMPVPHVSPIEINGRYYTKSTFSLRLNDTTVNVRNGLHTINPKQKLTFTFLSDHIPNVRAIFNIKGRLYLCEKITATFSETGMSQLLKGEFYPIAD
jgi:hypothetical protein